MGFTKEAHSCKHSSHLAAMCAERRAIALANDEAFNNVLAEELTAKGDFYHHCPYKLLTTLGHYFGREEAVSKTALQ